MKGEVKEVPAKEAPMEAKGKGVVTQQPVCFLPLGFLWMSWSFPALMTFLLPTLIST